MKRRLSAPEAFTWAGGEMPRNFALTARLRGTITADQLRPAVARARHKYPQIAGRIVLEADGPWYETDDVPDPPVRTTEDTWEEVLAGELTMRFPSVAGPLVRFVIVREGEWTDLMLICHHCIADGLSAGYVLRDVLHFIAQPASAAEPLPELPRFDEMLPPIDPAVLHFPEFTPSREAVKPAECHGPDGIRSLRWSLGGEATDALITCCHRERTTVHAALCAAFMAARARASQAESSTMQVVSTPISLRDRLCPPAGEHFGFFIHPGIKTSLNCSPGRDLWDMAREVKRQLDDDVCGDGLFSIFYLAQMMLKSLPFEQAARLSELPVDYDLSISNLGRLAMPEEYGSFSLEAFYGPAVNGLAGETVLGVVTAGDKLTFTVVTHDRVTNRAAAQLLVLQAKQALTQCTRIESLAPPPDRPNHRYAPAHG